MTKDGRKSHTDDNWQGIKRGQLLWHEERGGPFKVMTVVDGYVVMRRPGCMPFLETVRDVGRKWLTADPVTPNVEVSERSAAGAESARLPGSAAGNHEERN